MTLTPFEATIRDAHVQWAEIHAMNVKPLLAVVSARHSGKSVLFSSLAKAAPISQCATQMVSWVYIDLKESHGAQTPLGFWKIVFRALGLPDDRAVAVSETPLEDMHGHDSPLLAALDDLRDSIPYDNRVIVVLDHWDDTRNILRVHLGSLEVFMEAVGHACEHDPRLGMLLVTKFPTAQALVSFARENQHENPGLVRVSGFIERKFVNVGFPFLGPAATSSVLASLGIEHDHHQQVHDYTGGWLGLVVAAANGISTTGIWDETTQKVVSNEAWGLVRDPALRWWQGDPNYRSVAYPNRTDLADREQEKLNEVLRAGRRDPDVYDAVKVPRDLRDDEVGKNLPVPAILNNITRRNFLVVDSENLFMFWSGQLGALPPWQDMEKGQQRGESLARASSGVFDALAALNIVDGIADLATKLGVAAADVVIVGQSQGRVAKLFPNGLKPGWEQAVTALTAKQNGRKSSDDAVGAAWLSRRTVQFPGSNFFVLAGDSDWMGNQGNADEQHGCEMTLLAAFHGDSPKNKEVSENLSWHLNPAPFSGVPLLERLPHKVADLWALAVQEHPDLRKKYGLLSPLLP